MVGFHKRFDPETGSKASTLIVSLLISYTAGLHIYIWHLNMSMNLV